MRKENTIPKSGTGAGTGKGDGDRRVGCHIQLFSMFQQVYFVYLCFLFKSICMAHSSFDFIQKKDFFSKYSLRYFSRIY